MALTKVSYSMIDGASANINDFGAVGNGIVDDTAAIQTAFDWLGGGAYRTLVGGAGRTYKISDTIVITGSYIQFDGCNCRFTSVINANPAPPAFSIDDAQGPFISLSNFTLGVDTASGKGHGIAIIGSGLLPNNITIDNVKIFFQVGNGKNYAGSSMLAYAVYAYQTQNLTIANCNFQNDSAGVYIDGGFKIDLLNTIVDLDGNSYGAYLTGAENVKIRGCTFNGCGSASGQAGVFFNNIIYFVLEDSRIKGGLGSLIAAGDTATRGAYIQRNQLEHYSTTDVAVKITTAVINADIRDNVLKFIPDTGTSQTGGIVISDVSGGGVISSAGVIANNYLYVVGANTLTDGIKLDSTLNSVRNWKIVSNSVGAQTSADTVSAVITNGINLAGNGLNNTVDSNTLGCASSGSVTNGIVVGSGQTLTLLTNNRALFTVGTLITDNGVATQNYSYVTSIPTTGTWVRGNIAWDINPSSGGYIGWVCTASGTPGTWKTFGAISA